MKRVGWMRVELRLGGFKRVGGGKRVGLQDVWLEGVKLDKQVVCDKIKKLQNVYFVSTRTTAQRFKIFQGQSLD